MLEKGNPSAERVFRDPVHGLVEFRGENAAIARILETRAAQRLRRIRQMGLAWLVYAGAEHSRFGHALGAYHIASLVTDKLEVAPEIARHVRVAALLHDVGHGPFSHTWEQVFPDVDHERWGARIVLEDPELSGVLESIEEGLPQTLARFWNKSYRPRFASKLVSSQLDVDRLDYLLRDGHYSGAGYATYDLEWILHALRIEAVHGGSDPDDLVIDYRRGMYAVEQYLFARTYMYAQVYHHKTARAAERLFKQVLSRFSELARAGTEPPGLEVVAELARGAELTVDEFLWLDDMTVTVAVERWAGRMPGNDGASDEILRDLCTRFVRREIFKTIDLGDDPGVIDRIQESVRQVAERRFGSAAPYYYYFDNARQIGYHDGDGEELHVVGHPRYGTVTLGRLLQDLPLGRPTSTVRLCCAAELVPDVRPIAEAALAHPRGKR